MRLSKKELINKKHNSINLSPPSLLALGFLSFIIIGTLLLKLPFANQGNLTWLEACLLPRLL